MLDVNSQLVQAIMEDFYTLANIRIVLFDDAMREIMAYPENRCAFCSLMRRNGAFLEKCNACDRAAIIESRQSRGPITYRCHAGLVEGVMQVRDGDSVAGYIMFGQVAPGEDEAAVREKLMGEHPSARAEIAALPAKSAAEIRAAATILGALSAYMWSIRLLTLHPGDLARVLDEYIDAHIAEKFTAEDICAYLGIGRTRLYDMTSRQLPQTLSVYIQKRRISHARELLRETDMSVSDVAAACGFSEYNYFSRIFRLYEGVTPREYRHNAR